MQAECKHSCAQFQQTGQKKRSTHTHTHTHTHRSWEEAVLSQSTEVNVKQSSVPGDTDNIVVLSFINRRLLV